MAEPEDDQIRTVTIDKWASSRVAAVIAVALFITFTLVLLLTGGGQELIHRRVVVKTYFDDGTGLVRTADVLLDGIKVGEIKAVVMAEGNDTSRAVEVRMKIRKDFLKFIPNDSQTEITADNLVGDRYINIKRGQSATSIMPDGELRRVPPAPNFDPADLIASVSSTLQRASVLLDQMENPATPLGALVKGEDLYTKIRDNIRTVQDAVEANAGPKSPAGKIVYGQELYNQLRKPILDIDKTLADIQNGQGQYGPLLKDSSQYDDALQKIRKFRESVREMRASPMMSSDEQYQSLLTSLRNLNASFDDLTGGEGQLAQLLNSQQLYEQFAGSSRETRIFLKDFRVNPQKYLRIKIF